MSETKLTILEQWKDQLSFFNDELRELFTESAFENSLIDLKSTAPLKAGSNRLGEAIQYALFTGGKRFRPLLTFASCKVLNKDFKQSVAWAMAIECIHTYSLIHDDLPCMDNDDERRGQPTVHKKFDEATALLAGDALLTDAFGFVATEYASNPNLGAMIKLLVERTGFKGMVSGQANDLQFAETQIEKSMYQNQQLFIHLQKTAALISAACLGPFLIFNKDTDLIKNFDELSLCLGILFQLKDDFLDADVKLENNMVQTLGDSKVKEIYQSYEKRAHQLIKDMPSDLNMKPYLDLMDYNSNRAM